jgi:predicted DsbA family dithiol-disulfide isomerase
LHAPKPEALFLSSSLLLFFFFSGLLESLLSESVQSFEMDRETMAMELLFGLQELDEQCEELLEEEFQEKTNFEVSDALQKLEKLSIISKVRGNKSCALWTSQKLQGQNFAGSKTSSSNWNLLFLGRQIDRSNVLRNIIVPVMLLATFPSVSHAAV